MTTKIAINGFGRIGRQVTKALFEHHNDTFDLVAINDLGDVHTMAHLFKYDTNYGIFDGTKALKRSMEICRSMETG